FPMKRQSLTTPLPSIPARRHNPAGAFAARLNARLHSVQAKAAAVLSRAGRIFWPAFIQRRMPSTLRSRLIIAFSLTIFLSLILAGTATIYLLRAERERTAQEKIGRLAPLVGLQEAMLEARGITNPAAIQQNLETEFGVRILLIDRDQ